MIKMKVCLKTLVKQAGKQHVVVNIEERLPKHIQSLGALTCDYQVEAGKNYYLLTMSVNGELTIICQRCLGVFRHDYANTTQLAVCADDATAETLMGQYESTVASNYQIDLIEVLTDDLYLLTPEKHQQDVDCDTEARQLICD